MSGFLGVPIDAAYHLVCLFASLLAPLLGGLAAATAIVGFTMAVRLLLLPLSYRAMRGMAAQARVAPLAQGLRKRYAGQPDRLQRELTALYRAEGTSMFAGCLPLLVQWPAFTVLSLLFRSAQVDGAPNTLLTHHLFGAPLASYWLGGAGPLSAQGAVFAGLFVLLAAFSWLSARMARRASVPAGAGGTAGNARTQAGTGEGPGKSRGLAGSGRPAARTRVEMTSATASDGTLAALARVLPFATVAIAAFVPLAAGLYLATSTAWTLAERALLTRRRASRPAIDRGAPPPEARTAPVHPPPGRGGPPQPAG
jgi:YidC/Oxa1 family membrane protein insertase